MTTAGPIESLFHSRVRAASKRLFWVGLLMTIAGVAAILFPIVSTLASTIFVGWALLLGGFFLLVGAFSVHGTGHFFGALLVTLLMIAAGVFLLFNPLAGALVLTILLGVLFMLQGAVEFAFAIEMRPNPSWIWMLLSALASIILAVIIAAGLPGISLVALGLLIGVNFLTTGLGYMFMSRSI
ncbi:MAG TPA: DUF308 domain-containing protein [Rhizomicrobium sp.]|jgi:uncharacterized membrane protein HdeD (DUF308 family)